MTPMERAAKAMHDALGGNGWAYSNYGGDELRSHRDEINAAVRAVVEVFADDLDALVDDRRKLKKNQGNDYIASSAAYLRRRSLLEGETGK